MDKLVIGKRLRRQREDLSLSREAFAEKADISPQFLAELENGSKGMSAATLYKICEVFNVSADYILLGRQNSGNISTPAMKTLCAIPPKYTADAENILSAFRDAVARQ